MTSNSLTFAETEQIKMLKARYFRFVDTKNWSRLRGLFTDDSVFKGLWAAAAGPDEFVAAIQRNLDADTFSAHYGYMPEITRTGDGTARGVWAMQDYLLWPTNSKSYLGISVPGQRGIRGYGHYEEEYRRTPGGWRITSLRLTRLRIDAITSEEPPMLDYPFATLSEDWLP